MPSSRTASWPSIRSPPTCRAVICPAASRPTPPRPRRRCIVVLHAPGLALKTILAAVHEPSFATGNLEVYADLHGAGDSPHAIAASLDGSLGLAMAGGTIDNRLLGSLLGKVMDSLNALDLVGKGRRQRTEMLRPADGRPARHRHDQAAGAEFLPADDDRRWNGQSGRRKPWPWRCGRRRGSPAPAW